MKKAKEPGKRIFNRKREREKKANGSLRMSGV